MADEAYLKRLELELLEKGLIMKSGWLGFRVAIGLAQAPKGQLEEMEKAFFAGAQHMFSTLMSIMTEDREPTPEDYRRIDLIDAELYQWYYDFCKKHNLRPPPKRR